MRHCNIGAQCTVGIRKAYSKWWWFFWLLVCSQWYSSLLQPGHYYLTEDLPHCKSHRALSKTKGNLTPEISKWSETSLLWVLRAQMICSISSCRWLSCQRSISLSGTFLTSHAFHKFPPLPCAPDFTVSSVRLFNFQGLRRLGSERKILVLGGGVCECWWFIMFCHQLQHGTLHEQRRPRRFWHHWGSRWTRRPYDEPYF